MKLQKIKEVQGNNAKLVHNDNFIVGYGNDGIVCLNEDFNRQWSTNITTWPERIVGDDLVYCSGQFDASHGVIFNMSDGEIVKEFVSEKKDIWLKWFLGNLFQEVVKGSWPPKVNYYALKDGARKDLEISGYITLCHEFEDSILVKYYYSPTILRLLEKNTFKERWQISLEDYEQLLLAEWYHLEPKFEWVVGSLFISGDKLVVAGRYQTTKTFVFDLTDGSLIKTFPILSTRWAEQDGLHYGLTIFSYHILDINQMSYVTKGFNLGKAKLGTRGLSSVRFIAPGLMGITVFHMGKFFIYDLQKDKIVFQEKVSGKRETLNSVYLFQDKILMVDSGHTLHVYEKK